MAMKECDSSQGNGKQDEFNPDAFNSRGWGAGSEGNAWKKQYTCKEKQAGIETEAAGGDNF